MPALSALASGRQDIKMRTPMQTVITERIMLTIVVIGAMAFPFIVQYLFYIPRIVKTRESASRITRTIDNIWNFPFASFS